jgi:peroxiredoxin
MAASAPSRVRRIAPAPGFELESAAGGPVRLSDFRGRSGVVLFFMRAYT